MAVVQLERCRCLSAPSIRPQHPRPVRLRPVLRRQRAPCAALVVERPQHTLSTASSPCNSIVSAPGIGRSSLQLEVSGNAAPGRASQVVVVGAPVVTRVPHPIRRSSGLPFLSTRCSAMRCARPVLRCALLVVLETADADAVGGPAGRARWRPCESPRLITFNALQALRAGLKALKCVGVWGVALECWWGKIEAAGPSQYNWSCMDKVLRTAQEVGLRVRVSLVEGRKRRR